MANLLLGVKDTQTPWGEYPKRMYPATEKPKVVATNLFCLYTKEMVSEKKEEALAELVQCQGMTLCEEAQDVRLEVCSYKFIYFFFFFFQKRQHETECIMSA